MYLHSCVLIQFLFLQYVITVIFGLIVGAIYWQIDTGINGYQNRWSITMFTIWCTFVYVRCSFSELGLYFSLLWTKYLAIYQLLNYLYNKGCCLCKYIHVHTWLLHVYCVVELTLIFVYSNENLSGYYRVSVFFIAKVSVDLFCTRFFPLCFFTVITYFMLGKTIDIAYMLK